MHDYVVLPGEPGKYTICTRWVNGAGPAWVGRHGLVSNPHDGFEDAVRSATGHVHVDRALLAEWCHWRGPGWVLEGRMVDRRRLAEILEWLPPTATEVSLAATVTTVAMPAVPAVVVCAGESVAVLGCIDDTKVKSATKFATYAMRREESPRHIFGAPIPLLWFDEEGNGPSVVELRAVGNRFVPGQPGTIEVAIVDFADGAGNMSPGDARALARQLIAAADWAERSMQDG